MGRNKELPKETGEMKERQLSNCDQISYATHKLLSYFKVNKGTAFCSLNILEQ